MPDTQQIDPKELIKKARQASERQVITLQEDSRRPPPTIGMAPWQSILFGPASGQPSGEAQESTPLILKILLGIVLLIFFISFIRSLLQGLKA